MRDAKEVLAAPIAQCKKRNTSADFVIYREGEICVRVRGVRGASVSAVRIDLWGGLVSDFWAKVLLTVLDKGVLALVALAFGYWDQQEARRLQSGSGAHRGAGARQERSRD